MMGEFNKQLAEQLAGVSAIEQAGQAGTALISLWPLTDATQLDNDAKYGENLQVRITRVMARVMTGLDVTIPDAEFVYEGADEIPGRPQEIVDALLAANDACDTMAGYSRSCDFAQVRAAVQYCDAGWSEQETDAAEQVVESAIAAVCPRNGEIEASAEPTVVAQRLAISMETVYQMAQALDLQEGSERKALPVLLLANELNERLEIPRYYVGNDQLSELLRLAQGSDGLQEAALAMAPSIQSEWEQHKVDVLWDPDEAQRKAKEEDERKSREALMAKFAHIPEDPNKPPVEL
ncbi:hypothetical protein KIMH_02360 [Bombiscardovia apis]|uniref:Uncharacterized protein n=1 Tax=Bombiscardovia apis TaxID=2932182 RepID=A0ABM8BB32_9BIFI|nr:hypothetical protein [Bombiscardovia apis]BDR54125.1 hypothetical protein KIMH_02360 [Bombiscardovia apis]